MSLTWCEVSYDRAGGRRQVLLERAANIEPEGGVRAIENFKARQIVLGYDMTCWGAAMDSKKASDDESAQKREAWSPKRRGSVAGRVP